ncbi:TPA: beta-1,6-N-acetylglucosaminyltransferase, partial [Vibrio antiquarius]
NIGEAQNLGKLRLKLALAIRKILYLIPLYNKFSYRYIYKGSQWWALSKGTIKHILSDSTPSRIKEFSNVHAPDEVFFQSLVLNSKTATSKNLISESQFNNKQGVHYIDWGDDKTSKRLRYFYLQSRSDALKIGCIFARKIDFSNVKEYKEHIRNLLDK